MSCDKCSKPTDGLCCSVCKVTLYCNRDCQKKAWPQHKLICADLAKYGPVKFLRKKQKEFVRRAIERISGNICILASFHPSVIVVSIYESINDFTSQRNGNLHCAYIEPTDDRPMNGLIQLTIKLNDFTMRHLIPITDSAWFSRLKIGNVDPYADGEPLPVMFEV